MTAWESGRFGHLLVTVAGDPYQKSTRRPIAPASHRLAMAHAAFDDLEGVDVSDREITRPGPTYTVDTVRELCATGLDVELLVGADAAASLDSWHAAADLSALVSVGVFPRDDLPVVLSPAWRVHVFPMEPVDLSSTWVRDGDWTSEEMAKLLPEQVIPLYERGPR